MVVHNSIIYLLEWHFIIVIHIVNDDDLCSLSILHNGNVKLIIINVTHETVKLVKGPYEMYISIRRLC